MMKIGIIGSGAMGRGLCQLAVRAGFDVMLSNTRGKSGVESLSKLLGCRAGSSTEAVAFGDIVILAVPLFAYRSLPVEELQGKVTIDILNYFPHRDGAIPVLQNGSSTTSELLASQLPGARVVKALNSITADELLVDARPSGSVERRSMPIASDDQEAKRLVSDFVDQLGFDPVDAGTLGESWRFERFRPVYCVSLSKATMAATLAATTRDTIVPDGYWLYNREVLR